MSDVISERRKSLQEKIALLKGQEASLLGNGLKATSKRALSLKLRIGVLERELGFLNK